MVARCQIVRNIWGVGDSRCQPFCQYCRATTELLGETRAIALLCLSSCLPPQSLGSRFKTSQELKSSRSPALVLTFASAAHSRSHVTVLLCLLPSIVGALLHRNGGAELGGPEWGAVSPRTTLPQRITSSAVQRRPRKTTTNCKSATSVTCQKG
jgi:hypothetical protein